MVVLSYIDIGDKVIFLGRVYFRYLGINFILLDGFGYFIVGSFSL